MPTVQTSAPIHPMKQPLAQPKPLRLPLRFAANPADGGDRFDKQPQAAKYVELTAPNPTAFDNIPIDGTEVIVFDLETTGTMPKPDSRKPGEQLDDIIEISAIKYKDGVPLQRFYRLVKPVKAIPPEVVTLTGITNEKVQREGIDQAAALTDLAGFVGNASVLVGHNARMFDTRFVRAVCSRLGLDHLKDRFNYDHVADTYQLAQKFFYGAKTAKPANMKLSTVAEFFGYLNPGAHRAENDVETAAKLYYRFIREIRNQGTPLNTFGDLFKYQFKKRKIRVEEPGEG